MRFFSNMDIKELKEHLQNYFKIDHDISLVLRNNNKNSNLDKHGYDSKNNCFLTLKQLRLNDKNMIFITKPEKDGKESNQDLNNNGELNEKINTIIRMEEDDDNHEVVRIRLNQTFNDLMKKIKKKLQIDESLTIRLRK
jgi:hypothetical protein